MKIDINITVKCLPGSNLHDLAHVTTKDLNSKITLSQPRMFGFKLTQVSQGRETFISEVNLLIKTSSPQWMYVLNRY